MNIPELQSDLVDFFREWIDGDDIVEDVEAVEGDAVIVRFEDGDRIQVTLEVL